MALLKFKCADCGHIFEELTKAGLAPACPKCSSENTKRHYQGKCYFGSGKGSGGCSAQNCSGCKGCSG